MAYRTSLYPRIRYRHVRPSVGRYALEPLDLLTQTTLLLSQSGDPYYVGGPLRLNLGDLRLETN